MGSDRTFYAIYHPKVLQTAVQGDANAFSRGTFTAVFMVQCLDAIGCRTLRLNDDA
jgi:Domain of unknown function (DUF6471)